MSGLHIRYGKTHQIDNNKKKQIVMFHKTQNEPNTF